MSRFPLFEWKFCSFYFAVIAVPAISLNEAEIFACTCTCHRALTFQGLENAAGQRAWQHRQKILYLIGIFYYNVFKSDM